MKVPSIFQWPSAWLWGALGVLIVSGADGFWDVIEGAAVVTLIASVVFYLRCRRRGADAVPSDASAVEQRLDAIERRLTDTQDVMIAVSEKVDQWEAERSRARDQETTP